MPLFESNPGVARTPGPHIIEVTATKVIDGVPNGRIGIALQAPWGPANVVFVPDSSADFLNRLFPAGFARTSTGWYAIMRRRKAPWTAVRVLGGAQGILPTDQPTVTPQGTPGAVTYRYRVVAKNAAGGTQGSVEGKTTTGNATLDNTNYNHVAWSAVTGATSYDVYLVAAAGNITHSGKVGNSVTTTFDHKGADGDQAAVPTANTTGWTQAIYYLLDSSGIALTKVLLKYPGTAGNAVQLVVGTATDGIANHFNMTIQVTDAVSGTSKEVYRNLGVQGTAVLPDLVNQPSNLIASMTVLGTPSSNPAAGTFTFSGGSDGSAIVAADYDNAFTELDTQDDILVFGADDCGDSIRDTVNTDIETHTQNKTDRLGMVSFKQADDWSTVKTYVANYRDKRLRAYGWVNVLDQSGVEQVSPAWTLVATADVNLEPQQSAAWWDASVTEFYSGISSLITTEFNPADEDVQGDATDFGIGLIIRLPDGRYAALHDRTTSLTVNELFTVTAKLKRYFAKSLKLGLADFTNGPNVLSRQREVKARMDGFFSDEFVKGRVAADLKTGAPQFDNDITSQNTQASVALGKFTVVSEVTTPSVMEKILVLANWGTTVVITAP